MTGNTFQSGMASSFSLNIKDGMNITHMQAKVTCLAIGGPHRVAFRH